MADICAYAFNPNIAALFLLIVQYFYGVDRKLDKIGSSFWIKSISYFNENRNRNDIKK